MNSPITDKKKTPQLCTCAKEWTAFKSFGMVPLFNMMPANPPSVAVQTARTAICLVWVLK